MDEIKFFLDIQGVNFDPSQLKKLSGLENVKICYKGDEISPKGKIWEINYWSFRTVRSELTDFSEQLSAFLFSFEHVAVLLKEFVQRNGLKMSLTAEILHEADSNPAIYFERNVLSQLAALDCYFEIDLMG
ncbi:MAG: DUF4279 domain-containing protein [Ignavibacteriales bacterium]|nr:DUF4279 domain-containing protein [Ignavibacteriales bacterium]